MSELELPPELSSEKPTPSIFKREIYEDEKGRVLTVLERLETGELRYVGQAHITLQDPSTGQVMPQGFQFKIVANDLVEAFAIYDEAAQIAAKNYMAELERAQRKAALTQGIAAMANGMPRRNVSQGNFRG